MIKTNYISTLKNNKYDYFLMILISSLIFGMYGDSMQPIRIIALAAVPYITIQLFRHKKRTFQSKAFKSCIFLYIAFALSLLWTSDFNQGIKEIVYYFAHFSLFLLIVNLYFRAKTPLKSLFNGWFILIFISLIIAFIEIFFNVHMSVSLIPDDFQIQFDGISIQKKFASVTYGNYNTYVMVITMALPFLFGFLYSHKKLITQLITILVISFSYFVLMINASRGGLIAGGIILIVWAAFIQKEKVHHYRKKMMVLIPISIYAIYFHVNTIFDQVSNRVAAGTSLTEDQGRAELLKSAIDAFLRKPFFGSGIGSIQEEMEGVLIRLPHNLVLEILVQFGLVITLIVGYYFFRMFRNIPKLPLMNKTILVSILFSIPFIFIINSSYLLHPILWVFLASIYCVSCFKQAKLKL